MKTTASEVLEFVRENDVKFIRLSFCDMFGMQKNAAIMAGELPAAFENGVSIDGSAIDGFRAVENSDLLLFPDPATLTVMPWRPGPGRVLRLYCDIKNPDGSIFSFDSRALLKKTVARAEKMGYTCKIGAECEFTLFKTDENGMLTDEPLDNGGYLDIAPLDRGEDIRREICLTLEEMGVTPESSHHERGPGQNEIDFAFSDALSCADNILTFKTVVKTIAARSGLYASFMPKPLPDNAGNGLHVNLSLAQNGENIFKAADTGHCVDAESFIAGVLEKTPEMTVFLNPIANSYARFGVYGAPRYVSWSRFNRSQLIRIPAAEGEKVRMELRSPDPAVNPYLAFALIISAGLDGIERKTALPPAIDANLYTAEKSVTEDLIALPGSLDSAIALAENSDFAKGVIGSEFLSKYLAQKKSEASDFAAFEDKPAFYKQRYFHLI